MADALGQQLLIDLYTCKEESLSSPHSMQEAVAAALLSAELKIDELSCQGDNEEVIITAIASGFHLMLHAYIDYGYVAIDLFAFKKEVPFGRITRDLRAAFGAEKMKSTNVQRGDFGSVRDMKPRRKTKITTLGRINRSRIQIKNTGVKILQPGVKAVKAVAQKAKIKNKKEL